MNNKQIHNWRPTGPVFFFAISVGEITLDRFFLNLNMLGPKKWQQMTTPWNQGRNKTSTHFPTVPVVFNHSTCCFVNSNWPYGLKKDETNDVKKSFPFPFPCEFCHWILKNGIHWNLIMLVLKASTICTYHVSHVFPYIKKKVMGEIPSRHVKVNSVGSKTSSRVIIFHCTHLRQKWRLVKRRPYCFLSDWDGNPPQSVFCCHDFSRRGKNIILVLGFTLPPQKKQQTRHPPSQFNHAKQQNTMKRDRVVQQNITPTPTALGPTNNTILSFSPYVSVDSEVKSCFKIWQVVETHRSSCGSTYDNAVANLLGSETTSVLGVDLRLRLAI